MSCWLTAAMRLVDLEFLPARPALVAVVVNYSALEFQSLPPRLGNAPYQIDKMTRIRRGIYSAGRVTCNNTCFSAGKLDEEAWRDQSLRVCASSCFVMWY